MRLIRGDEVPGASYLGKFDLSSAIVDEVINAGNSFERARKKLRRAGRALIHVMLTK